MTAVIEAHTRFLSMVEALPWASDPAEESEHARIERAAWVRALCNPPDAVVMRLDDATFVSWWSALGQVVRQVCEGGLSDALGRQPRGRQEEA